MSISSEQKVLGAWWLLVISVILMVANVLLFLFGIINVDNLVLITLVLSWLAITFTALDIVLSADNNKAITKE